MGGSSESGKAWMCARISFEDVELTKGGGSGVADTSISFWAGLEAQSGLSEPELSSAPPDDRAKRC